eukprot:2394053-Amphidinium_carterae.1
MPPDTTEAFSIQPAMWVKVANILFLDPIEIYEKDSKAAELSPINTPFGPGFVEESIVEKAKSGWLHCKGWKNSHHGDYKGFIPYW